MRQNIFSKIPNWLTIMRVLAVPFVIVFYLLPEDLLHMREKNFFATIFFVLASITDWLDGYIARRFHMYSRFGEFLDPVADKLLICSVLIILVFLHRVHPMIALIIIGREIAISAMREWMATMRHVIHVSQLGKWKTAMQIIGISFLLFYGKLFFIPASTIILIGQLLIWIAVILTVISMIDYLWNAIKVINAHEPKV